MCIKESKAINLANVAIKTISQKLPTERVRWICRGIVVKVLNQDLDGFYKKKGFIEEITGERAIVQVWVLFYLLNFENSNETPPTKLDSGKRAKIHQKDLETVIPQPGRAVTVVKGELAKKNGILKEIRQKEFRVLVEGKFKMCFPSLYCQTLLALQ